MSMREYPLHDFGLLITPEVAAYVALFGDKRRGQVPDEVQALLDAGKFAQAARDGTGLPEDYADVQLAHDILSEHDMEGNSCSEFEGEAETVPFPGDPAGFKPDSFQFGGEFIAYIPAGRDPGLFEAPYPDPGELARHLRDRMGDILPPDLDIRHLIVEISGTYFS